MAANKNLRRAKKNKNDEFYTQLTDIEKELKHYREQLKNKVIFLNCDDPEWSNFWKYFKLNFDFLGIKKLISTHFEEDKPSYKLEYDGSNTVKTPLKQNGDFRSPESIELLKETDIVITNPPFSLFREYIAQLIDYDKKFLIMGNNNAITYKEIFSLIKENRIWLGYHANKTMEFRLSDTYERWDRMDELGNKYGKVPAITWFTNLDTVKRHEEMILYKKYTPEEYHHYDNYDAINIDKVAEIPMDYFGIMGVPLTFMDKYNPEQFEIIGIDRYVKDNPNYGKRFTINGKEKYARILIKRKDKYVDEN